MANERLSPSALKDPMNASVATVKSDVASSLLSALAMDLTSTVPAILYAFFVTALVILFSMFWQVRRKIAFVDWLRKYKPTQPPKNTTDAVRPPEVKGHLLFGNGKEFHKDAAAFLQRVGREYGDVATIRLMFRKIHALNDVHSFAAFGREPRFDFNPIVDQVNLNVFGFKVAKVDDHKRRLFSFYKSSRMQDTVLLFNENVAKAMAIYDQTNKSSGEVKANDFVIDTAFSAVYRTVLGKEKLPDSKDYALFYKSYNVYIKYFNYLWLGLPLRMFSKASKALEGMVQAHPNIPDMANDEGVCGYLRKACEAMKAEGIPDAEIIGHNIEFIHVHINAVRLAYWMILFILSDPVAYKTLLEELDGLVRQRRATASSDDDKDTVTLELEDIEHLRALDSIFTETLRLISGVLVIRAITQDTQLTTATSGKTFDLRRGESILFYPPAHHYDSDIFEDPKRFKWDRFIGGSFSKNGIPVDKPVMGFGTLCIGQRFATYLSKWYLVRVLYRWNLKLTGPLPEVDFSYQGHEILPPTFDTTITYEPRPETYDVKLKIALSTSLDDDDVELPNMVKCKTTIKDFDGPASPSMTCFNEASPSF